MQLLQLFLEFSNDANQIINVTISFQSLVERHKRFISDFCFGTPRPITWLNFVSIQFWEGERGGSGNCDSDFKQHLRFIATNISHRKNILRSHFATTHISQTRFCVSLTSKYSSGRITTSFVTMRRTKLLQTLKTEWRIVCLELRLICITSHLTLPFFRNWHWLEKT